MINIHAAEEKNQTQIIKLFGNISTISYRNINFKLVSKRH